MTARLRGAITRLRRALAARWHKNARRLARVRIRIGRALSLPTVLAIFSTACLAVFANRLIADGAFLVVGVLALVAAVGSASTRRPR